MLTQEQRIERRNYIGASDAAGVLGLSRWKTPLSIWAEKTGQIDGDATASLFQKLGHKLEQAVAELFMEETGKKLRRVNETIFHKKYPFLGVNLDRRVIGEDADVECKTCSAWKAKEWDGEEIPREYIIQCLHSLAVTGRQRMYIAVLIGNQDFKWKVIERDDAVLADLVRKEVYFWNHFVVPKIMPMSMTKNDKDTLDSLFPRAIEKKTIPLGDDAEAIIESLEAMSSDLKNLEGQIDKSQNDLRAMLGDAEVGETLNHKVLWTNSTMRRFDTEALKKDKPNIYEAFRKLTTTRRFLIRKTNKKGETDNG